MRENHFNKSVMLPLVIEFNRKVSVFRFQLFKFLDPDT